jgi:hypothetical protein
VYSKSQRDAANKLLTGIFNEDQPETTQLHLRALSRDDVYALKWVFQQAIGFVENEFEDHPEI